MASKSYSVVLPVIETSTDIMKDHSVLSAPFSVSALKHKHSKTKGKTKGKTWYLYLRYQWSHFKPKFGHNDLTYFVLSNSYTYKER